MKIIPIIIFVVIVINVLRRLAEFNRNRPRTDDGGWQEWSGDAAPTTPTAAQGSASRPPPSERVRQILEQLEQGNRPPPAPVLLPVPPPLPAPRPTLTPPPLPVTQRTPAAPAARRYLSPEVLQTAAAADPEVDAAVPLPALPVASPDHSVRQSLGQSLPPTPGLAYGMRSRNRQPYRIQARGRRNLRRAIVLAEVLGPPRAFDV